MATVILVRHGRSSANTAGVLAGRAVGVHLDDIGRSQAAVAGERLGVVPLVGVVSSPLERCRETAAHILERQASAPYAPVDNDFTECDYGLWQGRALKDLMSDALWPAVQRRPSAVVFPHGESMAAMQARCVAAIRRHDAAFESEHGPGAVWAIVSHGDIIKSILADALGMHLDMFQRINVGPASISIVHYGAHQPTVHAMNTEAGDLSWLAKGIQPGDAPVGGGSGHQAP